MKNFNKILIVLLVISVITSALVISAFAEDTVVLPLPFTNEDIVIAKINDTLYHAYPYSCIVSKDTQGVLIKDYRYTFNLGDTEWLINDLEDRTVRYTFDQLVYDSAGDYITDNKIDVEQPPCDGSSCPATDVNLDNICDDCGMTFSMLREFTPSDFPSGYPSVPSVASDARYYLYRVHGSGSTYIVVYPSTVTPTYDTTKQNGYLTFSESYGSYRLTDNEWVQNNDDSPYSIGGTNNDSVDILYSSVPIKDQNGDNFFPIPLWEKVEKVTQGEIPQFNQTMGGNLMTLTLCGVGCLTLLMALVLLSRKLSILGLR